MAEGNPFLRAALFYAVKLGWPVLPVKSRGKEPLTTHGVKDATLDPKIIREWWAKWPNANVGIRTGVKFWVLDIDPAKGGDESLMNLVGRHTAIAETLQQMTGGGGRHYLFEPPDQMTIGRHLGVWPGIDVIGEPGYILGAPSIHPSGKPYMWDGSVPITKQTLSQANPWLLIEIMAATNGHHADRPPFELPKAIPQGERHPHLFRMGCSMRRKGCERDEILAALLEVNQKRCEPPYDRDHIGKLADDICRRYPAGEGQQKPKPQPPPKPKIERETWRSLYNADYAMPEPIIDSLLYPGLTILGGRPKVGKSWLALQLALSLISNEKLGGYLEVKKPSRVRYVSLEDRKHQIKARLHKLTPFTEYQRDLDFVFELEPLLTGGLAALDQDLAEHPVEVLIVDSLLAAVKTASRDHVDIMQADYNVVAMLRDLAVRHSLALVLIAHTRKAAGDFLDLIQGTTGTTAAADAVWVIQRLPEGTATLSVVGREIETNVFGLKRDEGFPAWIITGEGDEISQSDARRDIIELLRDEGPLKPSRIAGRLRKSISGTHRLLVALCSAGLVIRTGYGTYQIPKTGQTKEDYVQ